MLSLPSQGLLARHYAINAISGPQHMNLDSTISPEEAFKLFEELEQGVTKDAEADSSAKDDTEVANTSDGVGSGVGDADDGGVSDADKQDAAESGKQQEAAEPEGVSTKDGRHIIPYEVLKSERDRAARAERELQAQRQRLAELEAKLQQQGESGQSPIVGESGSTQPDIESEEDAISAEEMEAIKEDFPTLYKAMQALAKKADAIEQKLKPAAEVAETVAQERRSSIEMTVQEAIDSVPKLAYIQTQQPEAFALAKQFDAVLRQTPAWEGKPLAERFARVAEMVEQAVGEIKLPQKAGSAPNNAKSLAAAAAEKARQSTAQAPTSLSDFPPGSPALQVDAESQVGGLSALQLAQKMAAMSPEDLDEFLGNI